LWSGFDIQILAMPTVDLIRVIRRQYRLSWRGIHGVVHWARVLENGARLAGLTGARMEVVQLFALFHDSGRFNEDYDPDHGQRGAELATALRGTAFQLTDDDFELLRTACIDHTKGKTTGDVTVLTCWDADRLDLGRVGIRPHPKLLCTDAGKAPAMISWAYERSISGFVPDIVSAEWDSD
jgi:uncharacterized protein